MKKNKRQVKLVNQIGKTASLILVIVFILLISTTVFITNTAITNSIDNA